VGRKSYPSRNSAFNSSAFLLSVGEEHDPMRMNGAIRKLNDWYVGDGWIKDGEDFHFDYYGSFVMHPMLVEVLEVLTRFKVDAGHHFKAALAHASR